MGVESRDCISVLWSMSLDTQTGTALLLTQWISAQLLQYEKPFLRSHEICWLHSGTQTTQSAEQARGRLHLALSRS